MATIKDVAQLANVSIATVSNYLNHTKPVSRVLSDRIKEAVDTLQYAQNLSAKSLKSNVYNDIGVILPNVNDSYYVQIFQGIESVFQNSNYYLNPAFSNDVPEKERSIAKNLLRKQVSGLILVTCQPEEWKFYYENFTRHNRPVVLIDREIKSLDASVVSFDNRAVVQETTMQMLKAGYRNAFLVAGSHTFTCEAESIAGFQAAHEEAGIPFNPRAVVETELNKEDAFRHTTALLRRETPDIFLSTSELAATGIIEALRFLGYTQEDIPVVTLGEEHWNKYTHSFASFSTSRPAIKMGEQSAKLLIDKLQSPRLQESERIVLHDNTPPTRAASSFRVQMHEPEHIRILMLDTPPVHTFCNLLKNFENKTGIHADITVLPHRNLYNAIVENHSHNSGLDQFDVYLYDIPWLPMLADRGILEEITERMDSIDVDAFLPDCMQYYSCFENKYYGIPFIYAPQILYYRKDLFDDLTLRASFEKSYGAALRPPLTFKEFNAVAEFFTEKTDAVPYGISISAAYNECLAPELYMRLRACGSDVIDQHGNVVLDNGNALKAYINFARALRFAKPDYLTSTDLNTIDDFLSGETAMLITYPAFLANATDLRSSKVTTSFGCTHIPGRSPLLGGWSFGINSRSLHKDAAFEFLKWTCNKQIGNYFALLGGQSAISSTYTNDELVKLYPWLPLYRSSYKHCRPMFQAVRRNNQLLSPNEIDNIVCKWVYKIIDGTCEIEEALTRTQEELESLVGSL